MKLGYVLGLSAGFHDAAATVVRSDGEIIFAGHSERYSRLKNDATLSSGLLSELCAWQYDTVAWYERPWLHNLQQIYSGQRPDSGLGPPAVRCDSTWEHGINIQQNTKQVIRII
jgi:hypothetical protein